jgi:hypothetical protein
VAAHFADAGRHTAHAWFRAHSIGLGQRDVLMLCSPVSDWLGGSPQADETMEPLCYVLPGDAFMLPLQAVPVLAADVLPAQADPAGGEVDT